MVLIADIAVIGNPVGRELTRTGANQKTKSHHGGAHPSKPRPGSPGTPSTETRGLISDGEEVPFPRPRIQMVHGMVPQKCAGNALPTRSGLLYRPAVEGLRCHPLPTSSTRAPEVRPN